MHDGTAVVAGPVLKQLAALNRKRAFRVDTDNASVIGCHVFLKGRVLDREVSIAVHVDGAAVVTAAVVLKVRFVLDGNRGAIVVYVDAAAVAYCIVMGDGAVVDGDRAVLLAHVDAAAAGVRPVVGHAGVLKRERRVGSVDGDTAAVAVEQAELVREVARDGSVLDGDGNARALGGNTAAAVFVVAITAGDQSTLDADAPVVIKMPDVAGVITINGLPKRPLVLRCLVLLYSAAVNVEPAVLLEMDDLAAAAAYQALAVVLVLVAVEHMAVHVEAQRHTLGYQDASGVLGVPVFVHVDSDGLGAQAVAYADIAYDRALAVDGHGAFAIDRLGAICILKSLDGAYLHRSIGMRGRCQGRKHRGKSEREHGKRCGCHLTQGGVFCEGRSHKGSSNDVLWSNPFILA